MRGIANLFLQLGAAHCLHCRAYSIADNLREALRILRLCQTSACNSTGVFLHKHEVLFALPAPVLCTVVVARVSSVSCDIRDINAVMSVRSSRRPLPRAMLTCLTGQ